MARNAHFRGFDGERLETPLPDTVVISRETRDRDLVLLLVAILAILFLLAVSQPYRP